MFRNALLTIALIACASLALPAAATDLEGLGLAANIKIGYSVSDKDGKALIVIDGAGKVIVPEGVNTQEAAVKIAGIMSAKGLCVFHAEPVVIHDEAGKPMFTISPTGKLAVLPGVHTNREAREVVAAINSQNLCNAAAAPVEGKVTIHGFGKAKAK